MQAETRGSSSIQRQIAQLEGRLQAVEKLATEPAADVMEITAHVRLSFVGPTADPILAAATDAKKMYDTFTAEEKGSPQGYRGVAILATLIDDEETDTDRKDTFKEAMTFIERACDRPPPQNCNSEKWRADQLKKLIEVARRAST